MQATLNGNGKSASQSKPGGTSVGEDVFIFPATVAQHRFWLLDQLQPGTPALNVPLAARLSGRLDVKLVQRVVSEVVKRHEILRTSFQIVDGNLVQIIHHAQEIPLVQFDLTQVPEPEREARARARILQEGKTSFDIAKGPLLRAGLIRLGNEQFILLLTMHHIGCDGWSNGVLIREVALLYNAFLDGGKVPELPLQYADFAVWQQDWLKSPAAAADRDFWRAQLEGGVTCINLPTDHPRRIGRSNQGTIHTLLLPVALTESLKSYCKAENLTLFMVFFTAYAVLLHRYSGQRNITIGSPVANRPQPDLEGLIGLFSNPLLLRIRFSAGLTLHGLMKQVRTLSLETGEHQAYPFEKVIEELQTDSGRSGLQWLQAYMVFQKAFMQPQQLGEVKLTPLRSISPGAMFEWMLGVLERAEGIRLQLEYSPDLFEQSTIDRMLHHFQCLLETIATGSDCRIDELPILTPQEHRQLVRDWNDTQLDIPGGRAVQTLFEEQVMRMPDAPAFQEAKIQTSYSELNLRANQLAHLLQKQGLQVGSYAGLAVDRHSVEFVVGFLAVLKAGGCCVALDLPNDGALLAQLSTNSQLELLVACERVAALLGPTSKLRIINLDKDAQLIGSQPRDNPSAPLTGEHPGCVLFTAHSGNGAVISHQALAHSALVTRRELELTGQDSVAMSPDEMLPALLSGARLVGGGCVEKFNANDWWQWVRTQGVTVAALPTTAWHDLVRLLQEVGAGAACQLRLMAVGGSPISPTALLAWQSIAAGQIRLVDRFLLAEAAGAVAFTEPLRTGSSPGRVSILRPAPDTRIYLLDEELHPVPMGVPGCLYVGGSHLAGDYLAFAGRAKAEFVADPISGETGSRLIKTGDTGRFLPGGGIELLGRIDDLAKTNGFRLELCEIRATVFLHPAVWDVLVAPCEVSGKNALAVYWTNKGNTPVSSRELRAFLAERLPAYMVPDAFVLLPGWPMTADGQMDRNRLPSPEALRTDARVQVRGVGVESAENEEEVKQQYVAPRNPLEQVLCRLWCDVLKLERIGIRDNYFSLGGHSLLAVRLIFEINKHLETRLHVPAFFQNPTIEMLAKLLARDQHAKTEPQLVSLQPGRGNGALFYMEAGMGLCRLAELFESGPASFTTLAPLAPAAYRAAIRDDVSGLPDLETLAAPHATLIQSCSFSGPCIIVGHSFGGLLAFEAAHQLHRAGRHVDMVLLLDSRGENPLWWQKMSTLTLESGWKSATYRSWRTWQCWKEKTARMVRRFAERNGETEAADPVSGDFHLPYAEADWSVLSKINRKARRDYRFQPLETRAVLFRARDGDAARLNAVDGSMGWEGLFKEGLEIVDCPGDHISMLKSPNLQFLVQHFQRCIEKLSSDSRVPSAKRG